MNLLVNLSSGSENSLLICDSNIEYSPCKKLCGKRILSDLNTRAYLDRFGLDSAPSTVNREDPH